MVPSRGIVDGVSYIYYPKRKSGVLKFPDGMLSGPAASFPVHNFRVKTEFGGDVKTAIRAQIADFLKPRAEVEEAPLPAGPTDALPSAPDDAGRPKRRPTPVVSFNPCEAWSAYDRGQIGQRHHAVAPRGDFSKADREELKAVYARVVAYQAALQARIDQQYPPADRSSADDEDAMEVALFAEPSATLRPTSATPTVGASVARTAAPTTTQRSWCRFGPRARSS